LTRRAGLARCRALSAEVPRACDIGQYFGRSFARSGAKQGFNRRYKKMYANDADGARLNELPGHIAGCVPAVPNALAEGFVNKVYRNVLTRVVRRLLLGCSK